MALASSIITGVQQVALVVRDLDAALVQYTERLGIGPDVCLERNPKLVYGRMTGWGQTGPLALAAGHDMNYIAITGASSGIGAAMCRRFRL